jgi:hypothetical protein|nr:MAG TPA: ASCH domain protein [Caudoviricetes sp.]
MATKPILFNTQMVRAILDGRKTCTRRIVKPQPTAHYGVQCIKPPYQPGDILYVRETWSLRFDGEKYFYRADKNTSREEKRLLDYNDVKWRPSIHMPKEAARIWLKVTNVRVERLQDISGEDLIKEGIDFFQSNYVRVAFNEFKNIWNSTIKKSDIDRYGWDASPWVWVIEFERCEKTQEEHK